VEFGAAVALPERAMVPASTAGTRDIPVSRMLAMLWQFFTAWNLLFALWKIGLLRCAIFSQYEKCNFILKNMKIRC
jgi:hypothetical protein